MTDGQNLYIQAKAGMAWRRVLSRAAARDHVTDSELAHVMEQFWDYAPPDARKYVVKRLRNEVHKGDGGGSMKSAIALLREVLPAPETKARVRRRAELYGKIRRATPQNIPSELTRKGRPRLIDKDVDWTPAAKNKWKLSAPVKAAWRRECIDCDVALDLARALDDADSDAARRARLEWEKVAEKRYAAAKEALKPRTQNALMAALQRECEDYGYAPPPDRGDIL